MIAPGVDVDKTVGLPKGVLQLTGPSFEVLHKGLDDLFADHDWLCAEEAVTAPDLFVSDMDSTMIGQECIDELADYAGIKDQIA